MEQLPLEIFSSESELIPVFFTKLFKEEIHFRSVKLLQEKDPQVIEFKLEAKNEQGEFKPFCALFQCFGADIGQYGVQKYILDIVKNAVIYDLAFPRRTRYIQIFITLNQNKSDKVSFTKMSPEMTGEPSGEVINSSGKVFEEKISSYYIVNLNQSASLSIQNLIEELENFLTEKQDD